MSLLLVSTDKGKEFFEKINNKLLYSIRSNTRECLQPQLIDPIVISGNQKLFTEEFVNNGFAYVGKKYGDIGLYYRLKLFLRIPKRIVRKIINTIKK